MPDRSIWVCPSRYRRLSTASVARLLRQNSEPAIADNALFPRLFRASQVYICRKTFGYLLRRPTTGARSTRQDPATPTVIRSGGRTPVTIAAWPRKSVNRKDTMAQLDAYGERKEHEMIP